MLPDGVIRDIAETIVWNPYTQWLSIEIRDLFGDAIGWRPSDPLIIDLDGDGIETVGTNSGVLFDHNADGIASGTGWVGNDDGFLVLDRDGNGTIDSGRELFGDNTVLPDGQTAAHGFEALAALDSNRDGQISAADSAFANLRVWRDVNQDGVSQTDELFTLQQLGISGISLAATETNTRQSNGNVIQFGSTVSFADGSSAAIGALGFDTNTFDREFLDPVAISAEAALMPEMRGSGTVRDLREAMTLSPELLALVQQFAVGTTRDEQVAILNQLIGQWGATSNFENTNEYWAREHHMQVYWSFSGVSGSDIGWRAYRDRFVHMIHTLEMFTGTRFVNDNAIDNEGGGFWCWRQHWRRWRRYSCTAAHHGVFVCPSAAAH